MKKLFILFVIFISQLFAQKNINQNTLEAFPIRSSFDFFSLHKSSAYRPSNLDRSYISETGLFKFHYTFDGYNAIDSTTTNDLNIPDWIYEADNAIVKAYDILVNEFGFDPPPSDGDEYDIYFVDLGDGYYGYTNFGSEPVTTTSRQYDYITYMEVDNNFIGSRYATQGLNALKVTMAHEFFHAVQLGYNLNTSNYLPNMSFGDAFFFEWSSVFFEDYCFPEVNDYFSYSVHLSKFMDSSLWTYNGMFDYAMGIFLKYVLQNYSMDILIDAWNKIKNNKRAFYAISEAIEENTNSNIKEIYNEFCQKFYFSGTNYNVEYSLFPDAAYFPNLKVNWGERFEINKSFDINDLEINALTTMPIEIVFNAKQNYGALKNESFNDTFIGSFVVKKDNYYNLGNIDLSSDNYFSNCTNGDTLTLFITNKNIEETSILEISIDYVEPPTLVTFGNIFPNPVDGNGKINVQISGLSIGSPIEIALFNLLGQKITKQQVAHSNQNIQIDLNNLSQPLSSGIYFLNIKTDEGEKTKKFTIVK